MKRIWSMAKADFLERSRRFSFIVMLALALFGAFCFVPDNSSLNIILVDPERFIQGGNPSWMTIASAWGLTFFLPLIGFFYVSGSLSFDEKTGVNQLAAVSPYGGMSYMLAKFLSGVLLLDAVILTTFLGSVVMILIKYQGAFPSFYSMISPYMVFLATAVLISALAILFDSTRFLRKSIGAAVYIITMLFVMMNTLRETMPVLTKATDISGYKIISEYIGREVLAQTGRPMSSLLFLAGPGKEKYGGTKSLIFRGIDWQPSDIGGLLGMIVLSLAVVGAAAVIYRITRSVKRTRLLPQKQEGSETAFLPVQLAGYMPGEIPVSNSIVRKLFAESWLMLASMPVMWYLVMGGMLAAEILLPLRSAQMILPLILLWPLSIYSLMGCREHLHDTIHYMAIIPRGLSRQMLSSWISGISLSGVLLSPVLVRMLISFEVQGIFICFSGIVFITALALFLGEWTRTRRAFEVVYITLAYMVINGLTSFSYIEVRPEYLSLKRALVYLGLGIVLGGLAVIKRARLNCYK